MQRFTFSLKCVFGVLALWGLCLWASKFLGNVVLTWCIVLAGVYLFSSLLRQRGRLALAAIGLLFALVPWTGVAGVDFRYPGTDKPIPTLNLRGNGLASIMQPPLRLFYGCAEFPLHFIGETSEDADTFVYFGGEGVARIRPFVVFMFWSSIFIVVVVKLCVSWWREQTKPNLLARRDGTAEMDVS